MNTSQNSARSIERSQIEWAKSLGKVMPRTRYVESVEANLFLDGLTAETRGDFESGDGGELGDVGERPPKMSSLLSSSALAVNFFDAWRADPGERLAVALGLMSPISSFAFEHRCKRYPVGPRTPNLDLMLHLSDGEQIAIESKFIEPYRNPGKPRALSPKYLPKGTRRWGAIGLEGAQRIADRSLAEWTSLDVPQLLKHLLGLRSEQPEVPARLILLWCDTGLGDAKVHATEIERFRQEVNGPAVHFSSMTYQQLFAALGGASPVAHGGWSAWMAGRYFA